MRRNRTGSQPRSRHHPTSPSSQHRCFVPSPRFTTSTCAREGSLIKNSFSALTLPCVATRPAIAPWLVTVCDELNWGYRGGNSWAHQRSLLCCFSFVLSFFLSAQRGTLRRNASVAAILWSTASARFAIMTRGGNNCDSAERGNARGQDAVGCFLLGSGKGVLLERTSPLWKLCLSRATILAAPLCCGLTADLSDFLGSPD